MFLHRSGLLRLVNWMINEFEPCRNSEGQRGFPLIRKRSSRNVQILVYHRVNDDGDPFFSGVPSSVFSQQMEYLAECFRPCSLDVALDELERNEVEPNRVVVTFDDGYRDNFVHAFPILQRIKIPATIFLATGAIGEGSTLWFERVFESFRRTKRDQLDRFGDPPTTYPLHSLEQKLTAQAAVLQFLRSVPGESLTRWVTILCDKLGVEEAVTMPGLMLSWDEIRAMAASGCYFGGHTVRHPILSKLAPEELCDEVLRSKTMIEKETGVRVTSFAYPNGGYGDFNELTKTAVKEAGYRCAVTTIVGVNTTAADRYELRRATPWDHDLSSFALRLNYYKWAL